ncbi:MULTISPECIES: rSAM-modified peptide [Flavobacterium]|uniref:rSAM-modified peptide n=1 Tax=Flavobacterium TaxID=237 RepID=UPI000B5C06C7|nr:MULTISPECIES: rSAM-modified peptide [Flavobacterium]
MSNQKLKFEDFQGKELSKKQQKMVRGGDDTDTDVTPPPPPVDPGKGGLGGVN